MGYIHRYGRPLFVDSERTNPHNIRQIKQLETCYNARLLISCAICRISVGSGLNQMCTRIRLRALF